MCLRFVGSLSELCSTAGPSSFEIVGIDFLHLEINVAIATDKNVDCKENENL